MHNKIASKAHFENGCAKRLFTVYAVGVPCPFKKVLIVIPPALYHCSWHFKLKITYLQFCIFYPLQNTKVSQGCNFCLCLCACPDVHVGSLGCPTKPCRVTLFCQSRVSICAWQPAMQQANNKISLLLQNTRLCCSFFYPDKIMQCSRVVAPAQNMPVSNCKTCLDATNYNLENDITLRSTQ